MTIINLPLKSESKVYWSSDELSQWLENKNKSTQPFLDSILIFLDEFNKRYWTDISFNQVLDIYNNNETNLDINTSIALCKAMLDFIQNNWIKISFEGKKYFIKYETLANTNNILSFNPNSENERQTLITLSITISSFIQQIKSYFRMIIHTNTELEKANVDELFKKIPWIKIEPDTVAVWPELDKKEVQVNNWSVKINDNLVIDIYSTNSDFETRISYMTNLELIAMLDYIYDRIDGPKQKKYLSLAKLLYWDNYVSNSWTKIKNIYEKWEKFRVDTTKKLNINWIKEILKKNKSIEWEKVTVELSWEKLVFSSGKNLKLDTINNFTHDLINLPDKEVQSLFSYLENKIMNKYKITLDRSADKLANLIQKSTDRNVNVRQKITNLRKKESTISQKFIDNNINLDNLIKFILEKEKKQKAVETPTWNFDFEYTNEWDNEKISLTVNLNWKKDLEWFIYSLNSLITEESKRQDVNWLIEPFYIEDFKWINLDSAFFHKVISEIDNQNVLEIFELFDADILEDFLKIWHQKVQKRLNESKLKLIVPGSQEELFDFVFNKWQVELYRIIRKQWRKWRKKRNNLGDRREVATLSKSMFEWIEKLTTNLASKVSSSIFRKVFSIIPKDEINKMIEEYLKNRKSI